MTAPGPGPALANLPPAPNAEVVPQPNEVMTEQQWASDQLELQNLMTELSETHRREANLQRFIDEGRITHPSVDPSQANMLYAQQIAGPRTSINQRIADLASRSDTSTIISRLEEHAGIAQQNYQKAGQAAANAHTKAADARHMGNVAEVTYGNVSRDFASGMGIGDAAGERKIYNHAASRYTAVAQDAETGRNRAMRSHEKLTGFDQSVTAIADNLRQNHEAALMDIQNAADDVTAGLRHEWDPRSGPARPDLEQDLRDRLQEMEQGIDQLSPFDAARAQAQGEYVRLRYRLESRRNMQDTLSGNPSQERQHTPDGGMRLYGGTADEVIVYPTGVTGRPDGNGGYEFRKPSGHEWQPTEAEADAVRPINEDDAYLSDARAQIAASNPTLNPDEQERRALQQAAFTRWEENPTAANAAVAHQRVGEYLDRQDQREAQLNGHWQRITSEIDGYKNAITEAQQRYTTAEAEATRLNALGNLNPEQQQQWQEAVDAMNTAQSDEQAARQAATANIPRLQKDQARVEDGIDRTREQANPYRYWRARMEVNPNPHNHPAAVQARWMLGHTVQTQGTPPVQPRMLSDGSLLLNNATMNGIRDPQWRIWPDGMTSRVTSAGPKYYRANGTPI